MQSTPTATRQPLDYGGSQRRPTWTDRFDTNMIAFAVTQILVGLLLIVPWIVRPSYGYHELKDARWFQRAGWWMSGDMWTVVVMTIASALAVFGATRRPGRRRAWYTSYVILWALVLATLLLGTAIVDNGIAMRQRWVSTYSGVPEPHRWDSIDVGPENYLGIIGIMLAFNPGLVLLTVRTIRARRKPADPLMAIWHEQL